MKKAICITILVLGLMEGISWWAYTSLSSKDTDEGAQPTKQGEKVAPALSVTAPSRENSLSLVPPDSAPVSGIESVDGSFPPPSTEEVKGVTERTIHVGVRQYAWDPPTIRAKKGELVRLIIHNADVKHGLVIPDLGVNQDISPDGAVVEFMASKGGTFEFFCSVWCGEGHIEMRGKIIIE